MKARLFVPKNNSSRAVFYVAHEKLCVMVTQSCGLSNIEERSLVCSLERDEVHQLRAFLDEEWGMGHPFEIPKDTNKPGTQ